MLNSNKSGILISFVFENIHTRLTNSTGLVGGFFCTVRYVEF